MQKIKDAKAILTVDGYWMPSQYHFTNKYDVMDAGGEVHLIMKHKDWSEPIKIILE